MGKNKKFYAIISSTIVFFMLSLGLLSPLISSFGSFSDYTNFKEPTKDFKYGTIELIKGNIIFPDEKLAEINLTENTDYCLDNCYALGTITLYSKHSLFDKIEYRYGRSNSFYNGDTKILLQTGTKDILRNEFDCKDEISKENGTKTNICSIIKVPDKEPVYEEYKGQELDAGTYTWKIEGKKNPYESVDWVATIRDIKLTQWLDWNSTFNNYIIHYWSFDENNTKTNVSVDLIDPNHRSYNVTLLNNITSMYMNGKNGTGVYFDGSAKYVCPANLTNNTNLFVQKGPYTINVWLNSTALLSPDLSQHWLSASGTSYFGTYKSGDAQGNASVIGYPSTTTYGTTNMYPHDAKQWKMMTLIFNSSHFTLYEDGVYFGTNAVGVNWTTSETNPWCFGANRLNGGGYLNNWKGMIDEVAIFNKSLTSEEIQSLKTGIYYSPLITRTVTVNNPANNGIFGTQQNITFNCSFLTNTALIDNVTLFIDDKVNQTITGISLSSYSLQQDRNFTNGFHNATCGMTQVDNVQTNSSKVTFNVTPTAIWYNYPADDSTHGYLDNIDFNCTAYDLINVSNMTFYVDDKINYTLTGLNNNVTSFNISRNFTYGEYNWSCGITNIYNMQYNTTTQRTFNVSAWKENNQTYNATASEGSYESFSINLTYPSTTFIITAYLVYNGTSYAGTKHGTGDNVEFEKSINVPLVNITTNYSFFWNISLSGAYYSSLKHNQSVTNLTLDDCSANSVLLYNFTNREEETRIHYPVFNASFDIEVRLSSFGTTDNIITYNRSFNSSVFPKQICINQNLTGTYRTDMVADYIGTDKVQEFYYIDNGTISNSSMPINIDLHSLNLSDSTTFLFTYTDTNYAKVKNAIVHVFRNYIGEGTYREVERGRTDNNGEAHIHLVEEDVIYYFMVSKDNRTLFISDIYNAKCLSTPCSINLYATSSDVNWSIVYNEGGDYSVSTNKNTRISTLSYTLDAIANVNYTIFKVYNGTAYVVNTSSLLSQVGSISLYIPVAYGNYTYYGVVYRDYSFVRTFYIDLTNDALDYFGTTGALLGGLLLMTLGLMAISEGVVFVVMICVGIGIIVIMNLVDMSWMAVISIICAGGVIIWKLMKRTGR